MKRIAIALTAASLCSCRTVAPPPPPPQPAVCSSAAAEAAVAHTLRSFYSALAVDDHATVRALTTPDFHAFEVGKRFTGAELLSLIADAHRAGRIFQWNVGPVDTRIDCNQAFATWENVGATGTAAKMEPRAWLESALLVRNGDRWVIHFLHSTPKDPRK